MFAEVCAIWEAYGWECVGGFFGVRRAERIGARYFCVG
jgi:hypothetical protein